MRVKIGRLCFLAAVLAVAGPAIAAAPPASPSPGLWHSWIMRGSVVKAGSKDLVICVGGADGAQPGQILTAFRNVEHPQGPNRVPMFARHQVGRVRIDTILDDHFATATVVTGDVQLSDTVELERPRN